MYEEIKAHKMSSTCILIVFSSRLVTSHYHVAKKQNAWYGRFFTILITQLSIIDKHISGRQFI